MIPPIATMGLLIPTLTIVLTGGAFGMPATTAATENSTDTILVGSLIHETKIKPPPDLLTAATKSKLGTKAEATELDDFGTHGDDEFLNSDTDAGDKGYNDFDNYNTKDGDSYGMEEHYAFGKKEGDGNKKAYHKSSKYNKDKGKPKVKEWHYEKKAGKPAKTYRYESDTDDTQHVPQYYSRQERGFPNAEQIGEMSGPTYQSLADASGYEAPGAPLPPGPMSPVAIPVHESPGTGAAIPKSRKPRRNKKEQVTAATEYDNFEVYEDPEEGQQQQAPAEDQGDVEYEPQYADADTYDYY